MLQAIEINSQSWCNNQAEKIDHTLNTGHQILEDEKLSIIITIIITNYYQTIFT